MPRRASMLLTTAILRQLVRPVDRTQGFKCLWYFWVALPAPPRAWVRVFRRPCLRKITFNASLRYDAALTPGTSTAALYTLPLTGVLAQAGGSEAINLDDLITNVCYERFLVPGLQLRRLTQFSGSDAGLLASLVKPRPAHFWVAVAVRCNTARTTRLCHCEVTETWEWGNEGQL